MIRLAVAVKTHLGMVCLIWGLCLAAAAPASARKATLSGLVATVTQNKVLVSTTIKNAFDEQMEDAVKNGIPATFFFLFYLEQPNAMWFDTTVSEKQAIHTLTYDPLKSKYTVTRSWEEDTSYITDSFEEACERMCKIEGMRLIHTNRLEKGKTYIINAKAELDKKSLPLYLHYVFFFVSFWDVETEWTSISFTY